jgi:hypothetical protein
VIGPFEGVARAVAMAASDARPAGAVRVVMDPHCADLPLPNGALGRVNVLTFRFSHDRGSAGNSFRVVFGDKLL